MPDKVIECEMIGAMTPTPMIIDTDPGVDDAFAIALAATSQDVDLLAVTTVFGNVDLEQTTANALRLLAVCGREDVPVAVGAERPLVHAQRHRDSTAHGDDGLSGFAHTLPDRSTGVDPRTAVRLMADVLEAADEPVTLVAIGPLTNVALLLAAHPEARAKIGRIVVMGGGLGRGNVTAAAEFNIWADPEAAHRVLAGASGDLTLVPLDLTHRCAVDQAWLGALRDSGPLGRTLVGLTPAYQETYRRSLGWDGIVVHDAVAVAEAIAPNLLRTNAFPVEVECSLGPARGATVVDGRSAAVRESHGVLAKGVHVAVDADVDQVRAFLLDRLSTVD
ncbi:pyrimidine-specific ribonucleoside hydrolase [Herbihabitans rhizosphaerae]|uniref:Pyrimidine-specific ribonucleoside hydrolase n=1 Tax=Herbihabitans rhizosphaerae TaxID=1872711 RepID=A0A4Q7KRJ3_9PSEU|nr:nucleoside hydrolase [Herbihabitans rhizosphaerae]RZS39026.1 pyrimidine-specific ribonucleoside hydrolase [Herbihabitans rhizosphaerae]